MFVCVGVEEVYLHKYKYNPVINGAVNNKLRRI